MTAHPLSTSRPLRHRSAHHGHTHHRDRHLIARVAIVVSWCLFAVGFVVAMSGQLEIASFAFLAAASAGVAVVGTSPRNPAGWVTAALSGTALIGLLALSIIAAALHA